MGVDDAVVGVPAFPSQIEGGAVLGIRCFVGVEADADAHQFPDALRAADDHLAHHLFVAQSVSGFQGVLDMQVEGVLPAEDRGDASLGQVGVAVHGLFFGDDSHGPAVGHFEGVHQPGDAAADDKKIGLYIHGRFR